MNNFKIIYKILKILEESLDYEELDMDRLSAEALEITPERRLGLFGMMQREGLIDGVQIKYYANSRKPTTLINPYQLRITLKGIEFLKENSMMQKCANIANGIAEII